MAGRDQHADFQRPTGLHDQHHAQSMEHCSDNRLMKSQHLPSPSGAPGFKNNDQWKSNGGLRTDQVENRGRKYNRDATEGGLHRRQSQPTANRQKMYASGPKTINMTQAADKILFGRMEALCGLEEESSGDTSMMGQYGLMDVRPNQVVLIKREDVLPDYAGGKQGLGSHHMLDGYEHEVSREAREAELRMCAALERQSAFSDSIVHDLTIDTHRSNGKTDQLEIAVTLGGSSLDVETSPGKKGRPKYRASRPPLLPPCRVCGDRASGFHYGVNTCEACKGFFRRSICKVDPYVCAGSGDCRPIAGKRTACSHCRFKRCIEVGMSKTAIKTGRYTHELRSKNILEVKRLEKQSSSDLSESSSSLDSPPSPSDDVRYQEYKNDLAKKLVQEESLQALMNGQNLLFENLDEYYDKNLMLRRQMAVYNRFMTQSREQSELYNSLTQNGSHDLSITKPTSLKRSLDTDSCEGCNKRQKCASPTNTGSTSHNHDHVTIQNGELSSGLESRVPTDTIILNGNSDTTQQKSDSETYKSQTVGSSGDLGSSAISRIPTKYLDPKLQKELTKAEVMSQILKDIEQGVNGMLAFSKFIPGFDDLPKSDKGELIKSARFDVWYIGHIRCFNTELRVGACEWQFHADELSQVWGKDLVDLAFRMSRQGHNLDLSKEETAALRAVCLTTTDRCVPLESPDQVEHMHGRMWEVFKFVSEKRNMEFNKRLPKVIDFLILLREFGIKFEAISSQLMLDWSILKENPLLLSVFLT